jgi:hypothetical protein
VEVGDAVPLAVAVGAAEREAEAEGMGALAAGLPERGAAMLRDALPDTVLERVCDREKVLVPAAEAVGRGDHDSERDWEALAVGAALAVGVSASAREGEVVELLEGGAEEVAVRERETVGGGVRVPGAEVVEGAEAEGEPVGCEEDDTVGVAVAVDSGEGDGGGEAVAPAEAPAVALPELEKVKEMRGEGVPSAVATAVGSGDADGVGEAPSVVVYVGVGRAEREGEGEGDAVRSTEDDTEGDREARWEADVEGDSDGEPVPEGDGTTEGVAGAESVGTDAVAEAETLPERLRKVTLAHAEAVRALIVPLGDTLTEGEPERVSAKGVCDTVEVTLREPVAELEGELVMVGEKVSVTDAVLLAEVVVVRVAVTEFVGDVEGVRESVTDVDCDREPVPLPDRVNVGLMEALKETLPVSECARLEMEAVKEGVKVLEGVLECVAAPTEGV